MPPEDNTVGAKPLTAAELGLLKLWIEQGATGVNATSAAPLEFQPIPESLRTIYAMDVSPDGHSVAVSRGNRVVLYDSINYTPTAQLVDESLGLGPVADVDLIQSLAFAPDGRRIATGGFRTVRIWKKQRTPLDLAITPLLTASGLIAASDDATLAAMVNAVGDIEIWNLTDNSRQHKLTGHADRITGLALAVKSDRLFSCDESGKLVAWKISSGERTSELDTQFHLAKLTASTDGSHVAAIDESRAVRLFNVNAEGQLVAVPDAAQGVTDATAIAFAQQPTASLIIATESAAVTIRNLADKQVVRTIDHGAVVEALDVSSDQTKLLTGGRDGKSRLWNLADGAALVTMQGDVQSNLRLALAARNAARQQAALDRANQQTKALEERLKKEIEALAKVNEEQKKSTETLVAQEKAVVDATAVVTATEGKIAQADADIQSAQAAIEAANKAMADAVAMKEAATKELEAKKKAVADAENAKKNTVTVIENRKQTIASAEAARKLAAAAVPSHQLVVARESRRLQKLQQHQVAQQSRLTHPGATVVGAAFSTDGSHIATAHQNGDVRLYRASDGVSIDAFSANPLLDRPRVRICWRIDRRI